jgi:hypothetical protein
MVRRLRENRTSETLNSCRQTRISNRFSLNLDDSGDRRSGNATAGVRRQYIGEIGKVDNGVVMVTGHAHDDVKAFPLMLTYTSTLHRWKMEGRTLNCRKSRTLCWRLSTGAANTAFLNL